MMDAKRFLEEHLKVVNRGSYGDLRILAVDTETDGLYGPIDLIGMLGFPSGVVIDPPAKWRGGGQIPDSFIVTAHNAKYDLRVMAEQGVLFQPNNMIVDTMAATHLLDENRKQGLKEQIQSRGLLEAGDEEWFKEGWTPELREDTKKLAEYLNKDLYYTRKLALHVWPLLEEAGLVEYWLKLECPMAIIAAEMEMEGLHLDRAELYRRYAEGMITLQELTSIMQELVPGDHWKCSRCVEGVYHWKKGSKTSECVRCEGTGRNLSFLDSPQQLTWMLFDHLGLKPVDRTDAGNPSTGHTSLLALRDQDDVAAQFVHRLIEYRELSKLVNAFYRPYYEMGTEKISYNLKPWGTKTGRWSCDSHNMQQLPKDVRSLFIPPEGHVFVSLDYRQLELYLAGVIYGEPAITEAYLRGENLHQRTADIAGVSYGRGKTINFALLYGLSSKSLAARLNVTVAEAKRIRHAITAGYSGLFDGIDAARQEARDKGYVQTFMGRRRHIPEIGSRDFAERIHAENQAVNAKIQGTAAELIKAATIKARLEVPYAIPLLQVHDEVLYKVPIDKAEEGLVALTKSFETAIFGLTPQVEARILERWS